MAKYTETGLINKGDRGELVARMILMLAYDKAQIFSQPEATLHTINFSRAVSVQDFLTGLLGVQRWDAIKHAKPDNVHSDVTLEQAFRNCKVRFTHFGRAR